MTILAKKFKPHLPKLGVLLLLMSFGVLTGFSTLLHAHELDFNSVHDGCSACHWSQSNQSIETTAVAFTVTPQLQFLIFSPAESIGQQFRKNILNRGPPPLA